MSGGNGTGALEKYLIPILYPVVRSVVFLLGYVPVPAAYCFCDAIARIAYYLDRGRRKRGLRHLEHAFPHRSPAERRILVKGCFRNLARLMYEMTIVQKRLTHQTVDACVDFTGLDHMAAAHSAGKGVIVMTAHVGNWEVGGVAIGLKGYKLTSVVKGVESGLYDRFLRKVREVHGHQTLRYQGAVKEARRRVTDGVSLAFVIDQHARVSRIWIPFFGAPVSWIKTPASLARRLKVPIIVGFCRRIGPGFRFKLVLHPPITPDPDLSPREDVGRMILEYVKYLESFIRENPEDYLWLHKRWRTPVQGEESMRGDGTYVRHTTFGSQPDQADPHPEPVESGSSRPARKGDWT